MGWNHLWIYIQYFTCICFSRNRFYKVKPNMFHAVLPITDFVIYHETKPGPFLGEMDSIYPDWAPKVNNQNEINTYINTLKKEIEI